MRSCGGGEATRVEWGSEGLRGLVYQGTLLLRQNCLQNPVRVIAWENLGATVVPHSHGSRVVPPAFGEFRGMK